MVESGDLFVRIDADLVELALDERADAVDQLKVVLFFGRCGGQGIAQGFLDIGASGRGVGRRIGFRLRRAFRTGKAFDHDRTVGIQRLGTVADLVELLPEFVVLGFDLPQFFLQ